MASYAVIYGAPPGIGHGDLVALVVSDGDTTIVYGDSDVADDLREEAADEPGINLVLLLTGLSYYRIDGPHEFEGDTATAGPPLAATYGLPT
jgi:hypothetical protein